MFMKRSCYSSDDYKWPVTANKTIRVKTDFLYIYIYI